MSMDTEFLLQEAAAPGGKMLREREIFSQDFNTSPGQQIPFLSLEVPIKHKTSLIYDCKI